MMMSSEHCLVPSPSVSSLMSSEEDILVKMLQLSHDPDGRDLDSVLLLGAMEDVMYCATTSSQGSDDYFDPIMKNRISSIESDGLQEPLGRITDKISSQILNGCFGEETLHARTMILLDSLGNYKWDAKIVLVLAAFATSYGEFWLVTQQCPHNPLATSISTLKQFPSDLNPLKPRLKALRLLVKSMVDVTKCVIEFEGLPASGAKLDHDTMAVTRSRVCVAGYWITRSAMACFSHVTDMTGVKPEQHSDSTAAAAWELASLACRLSSVRERLKLQVDVCREKIETEMQQKLLSLFEKTYIDNQEVLKALFAFKNDLPLKDCSSQARLGVDKLRNKVIILLISKPDLLLFETLLFLVRQTHDNPNNEKLKGSYEIVWVPISFSETWTDAEKRSFDCLSSSLTWCMIRQPWLLSAAVTKYIKQEWNCEGETVMVVLDEKGAVRNTNAIDMVLIWGVKAYPFSVSREAELWEGEKWSLQLLVDEIDPLLTFWVHDGGDICIFGSEDLEWIRELCGKVKGAKMVYAGKKEPSERVRDILATIDAEKLCPNPSLSLAKMSVFWLRLESVRRSRTRLGKTPETDHILGEASALLDFNESSAGWAILGNGSSTGVMKYQGEVFLQNAGNSGFSGSLRSDPRPPSHAGPCGHSIQSLYDEGLAGGDVMCEKCKWPMKKFLVYE